MGCGASSSTAYEATSETRNPTLLERSRNTDGSELEKKQLEPEFVENVRRKIKEYIFEWTLSAQATYEFEPGKMGLTYDDNGFVTEVSTTGQAITNGIKKGSRIVIPGDAKYLKELRAYLEAAENSGKRYEVTFLHDRDPKQFFSSLDLDKSGRMEFVEFLRLCSAATAESMGEHEITSLFWHLDLDGSGELDKKEFDAWLKTGRMRDRTPKT